MPPTKLYKYRTPDWTLDGAEGRSSGCYEGFWGG